MAELSNSIAAVDFATQVSEALVKRQGPIKLKKLKPILQD